MIHTTEIESTSTLRPPWLNIARAAWLVCAAATLFVFIASLSEFS